MIKSILFICTGNMCRSPMAEALMKHYLQLTGIDGIQVSSAGIMTRNGQTATPESQKVLKSRGIDISNHRTRQITPESLLEFDLILAMEDYHRDILESIAPHLAERIHLLREFSPVKDKSMNISDPYGFDIEVYDQCARLIEDCVKGLIHRHFTGEKP